MSQVGSAVSNPEQLAALLEEVAPAVREIVKVSPARAGGRDPRPGRGFEKMLESAQAGQIDLNVLADPEFQAAGQDLASYGRQVCGISLTVGGLGSAPRRPPEVNGQGVDRLRRAAFCSDKPRPSAGLSVRRPTRRWSGALEPGTTGAGPTYCRLGER